MPNDPTDHRTIENSRYINVVTTVKRLTFTPATIKGSMASVKGFSDRARAVTAAASRCTGVALADAEAFDYDGATNAAHCDDAANAVLDAADALCAEANALTALATLYRENK